MDKYGRLLVVPRIEIKGIFLTTLPDGRMIQEHDGKSWESISGLLVANGHTPYWRKYGQAPEPMHGELLSAHKIAKEKKYGAWKIAPKYMTDKSNERTAPKTADQALNRLDKAVIKKQYEEALKKDPTHTPWLNGKVRHNKDCQHFGSTKKGKFCTKDEGKGCGIYGG